MADPAVIPYIEETLLRWLQHPAPGTRRRGATAVAILGICEGRTIAIMRPMLHARDDDLALAAAVALSNCNDPVALDVLRSYLHQ
jgi:hypothetical protein